VSLVYRLITPFFFADKSFAKAEESELNKANFLAKDKEQLTFATPIKFNSGQIKLKNDGLIRLTRQSISLA
jgi:hypothetical protein